MEEVPESAMDQFFFMPWNELKTWLDGKHERYRSVMVPAVAMAVKTIFEKGYEHGATEDAAEAYLWQVLCRWYVLSPEGFKVWMDLDTPRIGEDPYPYCDDPGNMLRKKVADCLVYQWESEFEPFMSHFDRSLPPHEIFKRMDINPRLTWVVVGPAESEEDEDEEYEDDGMTAEARARQRELDRARTEEIREELRIWAEAMAAIHADLDEDEEDG